MTASKKILMIDDSQTDIALIQQWLTDEPYLFYASTNGVEGCKESLRIKPDIILLDILMPVQNGYDTIRELKKTAATKEIPVIFISTKNSTTDRQWGLRQGALAYLAKPFTKSDLLITLLSVK